MPKKKKNDYYKKISLIRSQEKGMLQSLVCGNPFVGINATELLDKVNQLWIIGVNNILVD